MRKFSIIIFYLFIHHFLLSQTPDLIQEMVNNDLQIRQKPDTESLLINYLSDIKSESDTLYGIIYSPMECPRCEAAIPNFHRLLKKRMPDLKNYFLITVYSDSLLGTHYNTTKNYKADYFLYDTQNRYKEIFSFNSNGLYGLDILKICRKTGRLITGGKFTTLGTLFVDQLIATNQCVDFKSFEKEVCVEEEIFLQKPDAELINTKVQDYILGVNESFPVSSIYNIPKYEGKHFFYSDVLGNGIMLFQENSSNQLSFKSLIQADSLEKRKFIEVPEKIYQNHIKSGMIYEIACSSGFVDSTSLGISYSLPHLISTAKDELGYFNKAVILKRDIETLNPDSLISLDFNLFNDEFFYMHFAFESFQDKIIMECKKMTWPMEFEAEEYMNNIQMNPFSDQFYETENPFMAVFNKKNGELIGRFGQIDSCQRKSRTGCYYQNAVLTTFEDQFLYTNGYTGQLYLTTGDDFYTNQEHYSAFEVAVEKFPQIDSSYFYTYEYVKPYNSFFYRCIEAVKMNQEQIFCLVRYGMPHIKNIAADEYTLVIIDRKTKSKKEFKLPTYQDMEVLGYGIKTDLNNTISPFVFLRNRESKDYIVRVFI